MLAMYYVAIISLLEIFADSSNYCVDTTSA